jgi:hypothetical protein
MGVRERLLVMRLRLGREYLLGLVAGLWVLALAEEQ